MPYSAWLRMAVVIRARTIARIAENRPIRIDSEVNSRRISFFRSPNARRIPISLVRSDTDMYIVTMIIRAETNSEIPAIAARTVEARLT